MWTSPSERPEPFGACGPARGQRMRVAHRLAHTLGPLAHSCTGTTTSFCIQTLGTTRAAAHGPRTNPPLNCEGTVTNDGTTGQTGVSKTWPIRRRENLNADRSIKDDTRGTHQGQRANTPRQQAGYTTAILSLPSPHRALQYGRRPYTDWSEAERYGGFDAVVGNPPWDRMKLQQVEWFAARRPEIAHAQRAADRKRMTAELRGSRRSTRRGVRTGERAGGFRPPRRAIERRLPAPVPRRCEPLLPVRGAGDVARRPGRSGRPADSVRNRLRQDRRSLLPLGRDRGSTAGAVRLRESPPSLRSAAVLPGRGQPLQVLCLCRGPVSIRRSGALCVLPPRCRGVANSESSVPVDGGGLRRGESEHRHRSGFSAPVEMRS